MKWFLKPAFFGNLKHNEIMSKKISYRNMFATRYRNQTDSSGVLNRFELYELKFDFKMVLTPL